MVSLNGKSILLTGGTGSFGNTFVSMTLEKFQPKQLIIYSRDEMKQWEMSQRLSQCDRLKFVIGDVRDQKQLQRAMDGVDYVVHAAATKIVPMAEYNPLECIKTNINGAANVIESAIRSGVERVVALSTDKASNPINLYGATKLASDKLFIASNDPQNNARTKFSIVRYGNVMGSRGSVIPLFMNLANTGLITITEPNMTRFMISLEDAVELVWSALDEMLGGEIYVKKIPSMKVADLAKAVAPDAKQKIIGIRPGEKMHEQMIGVEDAKSTYEYPGFYKIVPGIFGSSFVEKQIGSGSKVPEMFSYNSAENSEWLSVEELRTWIKANEEKIGRL